MGIPTEKIPDKKLAKFGSIPHDWRLERLESIADKIWIGLVTTMTANYSETGVPLIRNSNIKENRISKNGMVNLSFEFADKYKHRQLKENDIVTVHTGDIGTSAIVGGDLVGAHGFATLNTRVGKEILPEYLCYYFNSSTFKNQAYSLATGDGRHNLNMKDFVKAIVIYPSSHEEQRKIAAVLSTWDETIRLTEALIAAKEQRKKGLMQRLLTGQVRFAGFEGRPWREVAIGDVLKPVTRFVDWDDEKVYNQAIVRRWSEGLVYREPLYGYQIKTKKLQQTFANDFLISNIQAAYGAMSKVGTKFDGAHISNLYTSYISLSKTRRKSDRNRLIQS